MKIDRQLIADLDKSIRLDRIAGIDEVGRGPLAGPVIAAAVILPEAHGIDGIDDSKKLSEAAREVVAAQIRERALAWAVAGASVKEIDQINILQASMLAMSRAAESLGITPHLALVDGNRLPALPCEGQSVVKGDQRVECIAAASILAKVERDQMMRTLDTRYPGYAWAQNKGYPTRRTLRLCSSWALRLNIDAVSRRSPVLFDGLI